VADVGDRQVFEVARERRRVGLDRLGAEPDVERARVGALAEVHPPLERNAVDDDASVSERKPAADEGRRDRAHDFFANLATRRSIASGNCRSTLVVTDSVTRAGRSEERRVGTEWRDGSTVW